MQEKIVIVGAGLIGLAIAARLASFGYRVTVIEKSRFGQRGTSNTWVLMDIVGSPTPDVARLSAATFEYLRHPPRYIRGPLLRPGGVVHVAAQSFAELRRMEVCAEAAGLRFEPLLTRPFLNAHPEIVPGYARGGLRISAEDAPELEIHTLCAALAARINSHEGRILWNTELLEAEHVGGVWRIRTSDGPPLVADILVNAAGADAEKVALRCDVPALGLRRHKRTTIVGYVDTDRGLSTPSERSPRVSWADSREGLSYRTEARGEVWLSPLEDTPTISNDDTADPMAVALGIARLEERTGYRLSLGRAKEWAGVTLSRGPSQSTLNPVIAYDPKARSFFWAAAFRDFGAQCAIAAGDLAADLILSRHVERYLYDEFGISSGAFALERA